MNKATLQGILCAEVASARGLSPSTFPHLSTHRFIDKNLLQLPEKVLGFFSSQNMKAREKSKNSNVSGAGAQKTSTETMIVLPPESLHMPLVFSSPNTA